MIDLSSDFGIHIKKRLNDEKVIWLTTVAADGMPQPNPVWFLWDGVRFLIYTKPEASKLKNIARNPNVSLNLEGADVYGGDVVVFNGLASIEEHTPDPDPAYISKYEKTTKELGRDFSEVYKEYCITISIKPIKMRGFY
jgi:PPOX class probable F420-dependent enzyme